MPVLTRACRSGCKHVCMYVCMYIFLRTWTLNFFYNQKIDSMQTFFKGRNVQRRQEEEKNFNTSVNVWRAVIAIKAKPQRNEQIFWGTTPAPADHLLSASTSGSWLQWLLAYEVLFTSSSTFLFVRWEPEHFSESWELTRPQVKFLEVSWEHTLSRTIQGEERNPAELSSV